jgi:predicted  nucleic acid-binding Zn-ribbon protein
LSEILVDQNFNSGAQNREFTKLRDELNQIKSKYEALSIENSSISSKFEKAMLEIQSLKKQNFGLKEDIFNLNQKNYHLQKALSDSQNDSMVLAMNKVVNKTPLQHPRTALCSAQK